MENLNDLTKTKHDNVLPFMLESSSLRGRIVRLGPALDLILRQHDYPAAVGRLLGEAMALAVALGTALKFDGVFTLQIKSQGVVRLLVADVTSHGGIRAYAQFDAAALKEPDAKLLGEGYLAFTVDQQGREDRYQGIVKLEGDNLAEAVQHYFRQSEQIPTGIVAAARQDAQGRWFAGCLMLQRMPREGGSGAVSDTGVEDDWLRAMMLMQTCTAAELADPTLDSETLLYRLFHEEGVRVFAPTSYRHECRCSAARVTGMLAALPREEVAALAIDGVVTVTCEFCNSSYVERIDG